MWRYLAVLTCIVCWGACSNGGGGSAGDAALDAADALEDTGADVADVGPEDTIDAEADVAPRPFPPRELPFELTRPAEGEPMTAAEITAFTEEITGVWKDVGYFRWLMRTSTGVDASTGTESYLAWYNDVTAVKAGDTVTFEQRGGDHNMWIPGSKILSVLINGYALTGDWELGKLAEQYCKGMTASVKGFIWDEDDPAPFLMARAVFPMDHSFTLDAETWHDDGRKKAVQFSKMYHEEHGWNANTFAWPHNPTWGAMWVTNMRSKDDVCAIVRTTTFLPYVVADARDDWVREACQETLDTMVGFNRDIVDHDYNIRTKDEEGNAYIITDQDLGSYSFYTFMDEGNECSARLASDLIGYHVPMTNDCGTGFGSLYDAFASQAHYYNYPIIWNYHMAALGNALVYGADDAAYRLLEGMVQRIDSYMHPSDDEPGATHGAWWRDMAVLLVQAAAVGLPLTAAEARHVHQYWLAAAEELSAWDHWDLWDPSIPDGEYDTHNGFRPRVSDAGVPTEAFALFLETCNSPFLNPAGASFVDCDVVRDPARWGGRY